MLKCIFYLSILQYTCVIIYCGIGGNVLVLNNSLKYAVLDFSERGRFFLSLKSTAYTPYNDLKKL